MDAAEFAKALRNSMYGDRSIKGGGYIDRSGRFAIAPAFSATRDSREGRAAVRFGLAAPPPRANCVSAAAIL